MKNVKHLFFLLLLTFGFSALAKSPVETGIFNNKAIYGFDTVAYFTQNKAVKGNKNFVFSYLGADWYFSSEEHLEMFKNDPEKYAPQYGGYCAYAMADGKFAGIDEDSFTILNGKLYLNYNKKIHKRWLENQAEFIAQADKNYPDLVDLSK